MIHPKLTNEELDFIRHYSKPLKQLFERHMEMLTQTAISMKAGDERDLVLLLVRDYRDYWIPLLEPQNNVDNTSKI